MKKPGFRSRAPAVELTLITDLKALDTIVLNGKSSDYVVQNQAAFVPELGGNVQGTGILKKGANGTNDLIGIVFGQRQVLMNLVEMRSPMRVLDQKTSV